MRDIDLHGIKHEDVGTLVDNFIWDCMKTKVTSADIITGNSIEMKRIVKEAIAEYGYTTEESLTNNGILIINFL